MVDGLSGEPRYPVRVVVARSGVSADLLRAWERRYQAVRPQRSPGGQRLYSEHDVERLTLLRRATLAGHSIAEIARLDIPALEALSEARASLQRPPPAAAIEAIVRNAVRATERLDGAAVEGTLKRGALSIGTAAFVDHVISQFLWQVGERWHAGTLSPAHEHVASSAVRQVLAWAIDAYAPGARAPRILIATPAGELHEFGAMLAAAAAAEEGWHVIYLGASLPASAIVDAAKQAAVRAVALSAVYDGSGDAAGEALAIASALPRGIALLVGGAAIESRIDVLRTNGTRVLDDIPAFRRTLRSLRAATPIAEQSVPS